MKRFRLNFAVTWTMLLAMGTLATQGRDFEPRQIGCWPGYTRGEASAVVVAGDYVYVAAGSLQIIDVRNPGQPTQVAHYGTDVHDVAVSGLYAYVTHSRGLDVIDISNPNLPRAVGSYESLWWPGAVAVSAGRAYVAIQDEVQILDVQDPTNLRLIGRIATKGPAEGLGASGKYVYVAECLAGLRILDASDPAQPLQIGRYAPSGRCVSRVAVAGAYAYVADHPYYFGNGSPAMKVVDVSDPATPRQIGEYKTTEPLRSIIISGHLAYLAGGRLGMMVVDIEDPANPQMVGKYETGGEAEEVSVRGNHAYVAAGQEGLQVIDLEDLANPQATGRSGTFGTTSEVFLMGNYAVVADGDLGVGVIDISNPANPKEVGRYLTDTPALTLAGSGSLVCVQEVSWDAEEARGRFQVVDVSVPSKPRRLGDFESPGDPMGMVWSGAHLYVSSALSGSVSTARLEAVDMTDPARPVRLGGIEIENFSGFTVSERIAYAVGGQNGEIIFRTIDFSDPTQPQRLAMLGFGDDEILNSGQHVEVDVSGHYVYIETSQGLRVIDVADRMNPKKIGRLSIFGFSRMTVAGDYAYLGAPESMYGYPPAMLAVVDISDPENPRRAGACLLKRDPGNIAISGQFGWVPFGTEGLQVFDLAHLANPEHLGSIPTVGDTKLAVSGEYAYVTESLWDAETNQRRQALSLFNVASPTNPQRAARVELEKEPADIAVSGNHAFVGEVWNEGRQERGQIEVFDVSNAAAPKRVSAYDLAGGASSVDVTGHHLFVVERQPSGSEKKTKLKVIDVFDPTTPANVAEVEIEGTATGLAISGKLACLVTASSSLHVIDIAEPAHPKTIVDYTDPRLSWSLGVALSGTRAWTANHLGQLWSIDLSNPGQPQLLGHYTPGADMTLKDMALSGRYAYLTDLSAGLHVIDLNNPSKLQRVGGNGAFQAASVVTDSGRVFVMSPDLGLVTLNAYRRPPQIAPTIRLNDSSFEFSLLAEAGEKVRLRRSRDLKTWEEWRTITATGAPQPLLDEGVMEIPMQFYRAEAGTP